MWTLFVIYLAGCFATFGGMKAIEEVSGNKIESETFLKKSILSWYGFGMLVLMMLAEIGEQIDKNR